jgi:hypothetical protein
LTNFASVVTLPFIERENPMPATTDFHDDIIDRIQTLKAQAKAAQVLLAACQAVLDEFPAYDSKRIESVKRTCRAAIAAAGVAGITAEG